MAVLSWALDGAALSRDAACGAYRFSWRGFCGSEELEWSWSWSGGGSGSGSGSVSIKSFGRWFWDG